MEALQRPATGADKIVVLPMTAEDVLECPVVEIEDGAATARVGGPENSAVRYQFDLVDTARECQPRGDQFSLEDRGFRPLPDWTGPAPPAPIPPT